MTTVDQIEIIKSPAGATTGFPMVTTGDLNKPGPFNDSTNTVVSNIHQIRFHLDQGDAANVTAHRTLQRTLTEGALVSKNPDDIPGDPHIVGGFEGAYTGPDGPPAHEIQRPGTDTIVVADAPGNDTLSPAKFPFTYRSHFKLRLVAAARIIAWVDYDVRIDKQSPSDVPNTENTIFAVRKVDNVRKRELF